MVSSEGISESVFEYFHIELVQLHKRLYRTNPNSTTSTQQQQLHQSQTGLASLSSNFNLLSTTNQNQHSANDNPQVQLLDAETAHSRLESIGYRSGLALADVTTMDRHRFTDTLDIIKFLCKEFWMYVFKKQIDNLKTNHRGVYVLTDNNFRWISKMSSESLSTEALKKQFQEYLALPCGIIRGALANVGIQANVTAEVGSGYQCTFQIKMKN